MPLSSTVDIRLGDSDNPGTRPLPGCRHPALHGRAPDVDPYLVARSHYAGLLVALSRPPAAEHRPERCTRCPAGKHAARPKADASRLEPMTSSDLAHDSESAEIAPGRIEQALSLCCRRTRMGFTNLARLRYLGISKGPIVWYWRHAIPPVVNNRRLEPFISEILRGRTRSAATRHQGM